MLSFKQGDIKYHFFSFWNDSARDLTPVSQAIDKHSNPDKMNRNNLVLLS